MTDRKLIKEPDYSKAGFGKSQNEEGCAGCGKKASKGWALYCVKCIEPVREWQGLTENEIKHLWYEACQTNLELTSQLIVHLARNIESKLREKNNA